MARGLPRPAFVHGPWAGFVLALSCHPQRPATGAPGISVFVAASLTRLLLECPSISLLSISFCQLNCSSSCGMSLATPPPCPPHPPGTRTPHTTTALGVLGIESVGCVCRRHRAGPQQLPSTPGEDNKMISGHCPMSPGKQSGAHPRSPALGSCQRRNRLLTVTRIQRARYLDELTLVNADLKPDFVQTGSQKPSCGDPIQNRFRVADLGPTEYPPAASPLPTDPRLFQHGHMASTSSMLRLV